LSSSSLLYSAGLFRYDLAQWLSKKREGLLKVKKDFECLSCPHERWTWVRGWELVMAQLWGQVTHHHHCNLISHIKKVMNFVVPIYANLSL